MKKHSSKSVKEAGANLFADFGISGATEKNARVQLAVAINEIIRLRKLTQKEVSGLMNCSQPDVSALQNYKLKIFPLKYLIDFLLALCTTMKNHQSKAQLSGIPNS